ncbi:MAG: hypothetical protein KJ914_11095 [Gammaproteobacteria bacterium]|nr:hypothetical protein [Gammaproteobacteria bacterium]MBU1722402.1 hypothetical protein [Gammaproteobacteria bacterium]MBU2004661.1 hypothetical protein [Gammaproteobacteria bacterium]
MTFTKTMISLCLMSATFLPAFAHASMDGDLLNIQREWGRINYQVSGKDAKLQAIHELEKSAAQLSAANPNRAEPMIWEGIILSTDAGIVKSMSALGIVKKAKGLLEKAIQTNPDALDGSAQASLGVLYYQVPGWPVSFGDDKKAEKYLQDALKINPNGIDPNYFYGDFLLKAKRYDEAVPYLTKALQAPARPNRPVADAGRRAEVKQALAKAQAGSHK